MTMDNCSSYLSSLPDNISNTDIWNILLREEQREAIVKIPAFIYMTLLIVIGLPGNAIVLLVYQMRFRPSPTKVFIMAMAAFDLCSCAVVMPFEIVDLRYDFQLDIPVGCRIMRFLVAVFAYGSVLVLIGVAVDRFRRVCRPYTPQMTVSDSKRGVMVITGLTVFFSVPNLVIYGQQTSKFRGLTLVDCSIDDAYADSMLTKLYFVFQGVCWFLAIILLCIAYSFIIFNIRKVNKRRLRLDSSTTSTTTMNSAGVATAVFYTSASFDDVASASRGTSANNTNSSNNDNIVSSLSSSNGGIECSSSSNRFQNCTSNSNSVTMDDNNHYNNSRMSGSRQQRFSENSNTIHPICEETISVDDLNIDASGGDSINHGGCSDGNQQQQQQQLNQTGISRNSSSFFRLFSRDVNRITDETNVDVADTNVTNTNLNTPSSVIPTSPSSSSSSKDDPILAAATSTTVATCDLYCRDDNDDGLSDGISHRNLIISGSSEEGEYNIYPNTSCCNKPKVKPKPKPKPKPKNVTSNPYHHQTLHACVSEGNKLSDTEIVANDKLSKSHKHLSKSLQGLDAINSTSNAELVSFQSIDQSSTHTNHHSSSINKPTNSKGLSTITDDNYIEPLSPSNHGSHIIKSDCISYNHNCDTPGVDGEEGQPELNPKMSTFGKTSPNLFKRSKSFPVRKTSILKPPSGHFDKDIPEEGMINTNEVSSQPNRHSSTSSSSNKLIKDSTDSHSPISDSASRINNEGIQNFINSSEMNSQNTNNNNTTPSITQASSINTNTTSSSDKPALRPCQRQVSICSVGDCGDRTNNKSHYSKSSHGHKIKRKQSAIKELKASRLAMMMFHVTLGFVLSYLPHLSIQIAKVVHPRALQLLMCDSTFFGFYHVVLRSIYLNHAINPLIYGYYNKNFRKYCSILLMSPLKFFRKSSATSTEKSHSFSMEQA